MALEASSYDHLKWYAQMRQVFILFSVRSYDEEDRYSLPLVGV